MKREVVLDFETASAVDLIRAGSSRYAEDWSTEVTTTGYKIDGVRRVWHPGEPEGDLLALANDANVLFIAHNAGFEKDIWRAIMVEQHGFPDIPNNRWHDTQAVAAMKALPQKLDNLVRVLGTGKGKDTEGSKLAISLSKINPKTGKLLVARTPEMMARLDKYVLSDCDEEEEVHKRIGGFQPGERRVWLLDQRINERGVGIDMDYVNACQKIVDDASGPLAREFQDITGGLGFGQVAKVQSWLKSEKVFLPDLRKETLAEFLGKDIDNAEVGDLAGDEPANDYHLPEHVRRALEIRQLVGSASVKKLSRMRDCICADGRARRLLQYHGAGPGRWAGRILQPQNFPRPTLRFGNDAVSPELIIQALQTGDHEYVEMMIGPAVETVVSGLRHALIAAPGKQFVSGDYMQIEARIVLALAGQWDKVEVFVTGKPYIDMAQQIYKRKIDKHNDLKEYTIGKNTVLGCGFQMGARKFFSRYCPAQSLDFAEGVIKTYREDWAPEVPKVWRALEAAALNTVLTGQSHEAYGVEYRIETEWMTARLPSGRKLFYFQPTACWKTMPWSDPSDPDIRRAWYYSAFKQGQWKRVDAFGGLLTENVVQALARDLLVDATFKLEQNNYPVVLTVHDEDLSEIENERVDEKAFKQIMEDAPEWARAMRIPVAAETWTAERYRK